MNRNLNIGFFILVAIGLIVLLVFIRKKLKLLVLPNVVLITGAPKTGKSALTIHLAIKQYRKNCFMWFLGKCFYWLRYHTTNDYPFKPMLYSNIPLKTMHNKLTLDIIQRKVKVPKKSVFIIDEASLLADSMLFKDDSINFNLLLFFKLIGHTTYGGSIYCNSHSLSDLHYSLKRVIGRYLYIYKTSKYPLISICKVREMVYSDDSSVVNDVSEDAELSMRTVVFANWNYKKYDCFCYSVFTDSLPYQVDYEYEYKKDDLKAREIISFNPRFQNIKLKENDDA